MRPRSPPVSFSVFRLPVLPRQHRRDAGQVPDKSIAAMIVADTRAPHRGRQVQCARESCRPRDDTRARQWQLAHVSRHPYDGALDGDAQAPAVFLRSRRNRS